MRVLRISDCHQRPGYRRHDLMMKPPSGGRLTGNGAGRTEENHMPDYNHRIVITDGVRLKEMILHARATGAEANLAFRLLSLLDTCLMTAVEPFAGSAAISPDFKLEPAKRNTTAIISVDHARMSLAWGIFAHDAQQPPCLPANGDRFTVYNGGFIYSGPSQPLNGSASALTVSLDRPSGQPNWSIHT